MLLGWRKAIADAGRRQLTMSSTLKDEVFKNSYFVFVL